MPCGFEEDLTEFESAQYSYTYSSYPSSQSDPDHWTHFDPETLEVVEDSLADASSTTVDSLKDNNSASGDSVKKTKVESQVDKSQQIRDTTKMSSATCGVSSSSIFGGLCSGNSRRPSMFTAKYRLREERKKVLKMSMAKVKRIEDPESFLRRSVLINNTIKRLQREVREEKMMRHGGYSSKLSCSSFRKSFACSRLSDMHLPDDDTLSMTSSRPLSRSHHNNNNNNSRKRPLSDDSEEDCDVHAVLSQIYVPPTPCIISSIDDDDCCDSTNDLDNSPTKRAKLSLSSDASSLLVTDECSLDVDVDVDVDVVGDSETSDWPTPPEPIQVSSPPMIVSPCSAMGSSVVGDSMDSSSIEIDTSDANDVDVLSQPSVAMVGDESSGDCEFSLDLHPRSSLSSSLNPLSMSSVCSVNPMSTNPVTTMVTTPSSSEALQVSSSFESEGVEDMTSSDTKENTCTLPISSSCCSTTTNTNALIPSTDRKCSNNNHNNNHNGATNMGGTGSMSPPSSTDTSTSSSASADKQYSSCGHSSIFGELQSVVFHSLIASLET